MRALASFTFVLLLFGCRGRERERESEEEREEEREREREHEQEAGQRGDKLAWPPLDEGALIGTVMTRGFELGLPDPVAITPDGAVLFRRAKARDPRAELYQFDAAGKTAVLASATALAGVAETRGIGEVDLDASGAHVL